MTRDYFFQFLYLDFLIQEDLAAECWLVPAAVIEMVCGEPRVKAKLD